MDYATLFKTTTKTKVKPKSFTDYLKQRQEEKMGITHTAPTLPEVPQENFGMNMLEKASDISSGFLSTLAKPLEWLWKGTTEGLKASEKALQVPAGVLEGKSIKQAYQQAPTIGQNVGELVRPFVKGAEEKLIQNKGQGLGTALVAALPDILPQLVDELIVPAAALGIIGSEVSTRYVNLKVKPEQIREVLNSDKPLTPVQRTVLQDMADKNVSIEIKGTKPAGGFREFLGKYVLGGRAKTGGTVKVSTPTKALPETGAIQPVTALQFPKSDPTGATVPVTIPKAVTFPKSQTEVTQSKETTLPTNDDSHRPNKTSGVAKSIEAKAIEQGLVDKGFDELAQFQGTTFKEQSELMANADVEDLRKIVRGEIPMPSRYRSAAVISTLEDIAKQTKDVQLMYDLANSPLTSEISESASELSLARMREKDSATMKLLEIKKAREARAEKQISPEKRKLAKSAKTETETVNLSKEELSWDKFLAEIQC